MICGLALLGVITATLAAWLIAQVSIVEEVEAKETRAELAELAEIVEALREELVRTRSGNSAPAEESRTTG